MFTFSEVKKLLSFTDRNEVETFLATLDADICNISNAADIAIKLFEITEDGQQTALLLNALSDGPVEATTDNWRIIDVECIDRILAEELESDSYILGCFEAWAIAEATNWPIELIRAAQKGEAFSEIGDAMDKEQVKELARIYANEDGYGHHFAHYDGKEYEIITRDSTGAATDLYYLFRTN